MTFKNKISAGFGTALAILVLVGVLSYRSMVHSDEDRQWVTHTHQVLEQVNAVMTDLLSAVRAYQLNASAVQAAKSMIQQSLELLK